jgi:hypothetical protein
MQYQQHQSWRVRSDLPSQHILDLRSLYCLLLVSVLNAADDMGAAARPHSGGAGAGFAGHGRDGRGK